MKRLRYLFVAIAMLCMVSLYAQDATQNWGHLPEAQMHSTSVMQGSGSTLPSAAVTGVSTTYSPAKAPNGPRRAIDDGDDEDKPEGWDDPMKDPLGDAMLPLALLAIAYGAGCMVYKRRKRSA